MFFAKGGSDIGLEYALMILMDISLVCLLWFSSGIFALGDVNILDAIHCWFSKMIFLTHQDALEKH